MIGSIVAGIIGGATSQLRRSSHEDQDSERIQILKGVMHSKSVPTMLKVMNEDKSKVQRKDLSELSPKQCDELQRLTLFSTTPRDYIQCDQRNMQSRCCLGKGLSTYPLIVILITKKNEIESSSIVGHGHVRPNQSEYSSPVLFVKKKMLLGVRVDFKALNKGTITDKFPILVIEELLDKLHRSRFFSKLDLKFGYHQVMMKEEDIHKIDFRLMNAFQVGNAFSTFQAHMNIVSR